MRRLIAFLIVTLRATLSLSQTTAPAPVKLVYSFSAGDTLHYEYRLDMNQNGQMAGSSFLAKVTIESVTPNGDATLLITKTGKAALATYSNRGSGVQNDETSVVNDDEIVRITIDKYGYYIKSEHLVVPQHIRDTRERYKRTKTDGHVIDDSTMAKLLLKDLFPKLPRTSSIMIGNALVDSVVINREIVRYTQLSGAASGSNRTPQVIHDKEITIDSIIYITDEIHFGEPCRKLIVFTAYTPSVAVPCSPQRSVKTVLVRKKDGVIISSVRTNDEPLRSESSRSTIFEEALILK